MAGPLFDQMLTRAMEEEHLEDQRAKFAPKPVPQPPAPKPIDPKMAMILGSLADSASTYAMLKAGTKQEANPALNVFNRHPWTVIPAAAGGALGYTLLHKLISKKAPKLADTLAGSVGAFHGALSGGNMENEPVSAFAAAGHDLRFGK